MKPIPLRQFDWCAYDYDTLDENSIMGYGETEAEAIADLMEHLEHQRQTK